MLNLLNFFLITGADVNAKNRGGATPASGLYLPWGMLKFMTSMFDIDLKQEEVEAGRKEIAELLKERNFSTAQKVPSGLWEAVFIGDLKAVKQAIADGTDVNARNPQSGDPLLFTASVMGHTDIIAFLLAKGADVNVRNRDGNTSLHAAAFLGRAEAAKLLLKHGIDIHVKNSSGGSAMDNTTLDWGITQTILNAIQIKVDRKEVEAGRAEIAKLIVAYVNKNPSQSQNLWKAAADGDLPAIKTALKKRFRY